METIFVLNVEVCFIKTILLILYSTFLLAAWDIKAYKCSRGAGCELWEDDDMLLEEDQRQGGANAEEVIAPPQPLVNVPEAAPPLYQEHQAIGDFDWIHDDGMCLYSVQATY